METAITTTAFTTRIDRFIQRNNVMSLAVSGDAILWAACVFYAFDVHARRLLYFTNLDTLHGRLAQSNPDVVATIAAQGGDVAKLQGVQIKGLSGLLQGEEAERARARFLTDFPALGVVTAPIWALVPAYVKMVDNTVSFGYKEEWPTNADGEC
jgi:uncharacterized protein YhbP (UPF0306 family)